MRRSMSKVYVLAWLGTLLAAGCGDDGSAAGSCPDSSDTCKDCTTDTECGPGEFCDGTTGQCYNPCLLRGAVDRLQVTNVDKVDLLFMVDKSGSMVEEQALLAEQFPRLVSILATGDADEDGTEDFPPVKDLNLGVVTSDIGLPGIDRTNLGCSAQGDDARLITQTANAGSPGKENCQPTYPRFLTFSPDEGDSANVVAQKFGCLATVGAGGCGFEQQLEAVLKALAPAGLEADVMGDANPEPVRFLDADGQLNAVGHGGSGYNANFLRDDSLLGVIVVTDEEDCSAQNLGHLEHELPQNSPVRANCPETVAEPGGINARCSCDWVQNNYLWPIKRYVNGLKALKPERENRVMFGTISGVPPQLVDDQAKMQFDNLQSAEDREAFYNNLLSHDRMQKVLDTSLDPLNVQTSCVSPGDGSAKPPRRIVEVARQFDENGVVESICNDDFSGALDSIIDVISNVLNAVCLPRELEREGNGLVDCDVVWELPRPSPSSPPDAPTTCDDAPYLEPPPSDRPQQTSDGKARCVVDQIPVRDTNMDGTITNADWPTEDQTGQGWFYDDFSDAVIRSCADIPQRIFFTETAKPPEDVEVRLECLEQEDEPRQGPAVGDRCTPTRTSGCGLADPGAGCRGGPDDLCCHPRFGVCMQTCTSDDVCPRFWICSTEPAVQSEAGLPPGDDEGICITPKCG